MQRSHTEANAVGFHDFDGNQLTINFESGDSIKADVVIIAIGVRPNSELAVDAGLKTSDAKHITVNEYQQTSDPHIYAVGDVVESQEPILGKYVNVPLGGPANRQGRVAADHMINGTQCRPYLGSIGTAIVRVFDRVVGTTGWTGKHLKRAGVPFRSTTITDFGHASYYPGANYLTIKLIWEEGTHRILGAQCSGVDGVDKRLDIMATAIRGQLTLEQLEHLELAYAPPFGSAKDPVNTVAFQALNEVDDLTDMVYTVPEDAVLLDVRPAEVVKVKPIKNALNIPYEELRARLHELHPEQRIVCVCVMSANSATLPHEF